MAYKVKKEKSLMDDEEKLDKYLKSKYDVQIEEQEKGFY